MPHRQTLATSFHFFFFFFFWWVREAALPPNQEIYQRGDVVSRPQLLTVLWSSAPSPGTACSLELSLLSPAGIWFKTPLPVGGANTAVSDLLGVKWSPGTQKKEQIYPIQLQRPGVWGSPTAGTVAEYPLNQWGASCPTLALVTPACN